jgi:hypothetical protein
MGGSCDSTSLDIFDSTIKDLLRDGAAISDRKQKMIHVMIDGSYLLQGARTHSFKAPKGYDDDALVSVDIQRLMEIICKLRSVVSGHVAASSQQFKKGQLQNQWKTQLNNCCGNNVVSVEICEGHSEQNSQQLAEISLFQHAMQAVNAPDELVSPSSPTLIFVLGRDANNGDHGNDANIPQVIQQAVMRDWGVEMWAWEHDIADVYLAFQHEYSRNVSIHFLDKYRSEITKFASPVKTKYPLTSGAEAGYASASSMLDGHNESYYDPFALFSEGVSPAQSRNSGRGGRKVSPVSLLPTSSLSSSTSSSSSSASKLRQSSLSTDSSSLLSPASAATLTPPPLPRPTGINGSSNGKVERSTTSNDRSAPDASGYVVEDLPDPFEVFNIKKLEGSESNKGTTPRSISSLYSNSSPMTTPNKFKTAAVSDDGDYSLLPSAASTPPVPQVQFDAEVIIQLHFYLVVCTGVIFVYAQLITCPISQMRMTDPVLVTKCGHTFDRSCIEDWLTNKKTCPTCNHAMQQSVNDRNIFFNCQVLTGVCFHGRT